MQNNERKGEEKRTWRKGKRRGKQGGKGGKKKGKMRKKRGEEDKKKRWEAAKGKGFIKNPTRCKHKGALGAPLLCTQCTHKPMCEGANALGGCPCARHTAATRVKRGKQ